MPMRNHESILVFGRPGSIKAATYNPQKDGSRQTSDGNRHPCSVLPFKSDKNANHGLHPTLKPLALMEWLVKTYTNEGDTVIDPFFGSDTTAIACAIHGRRFIGIEREGVYYETAIKRIEAVCHDKSKGSGKSVERISCENA
jgi:site-specific DNA-methyltransferase (adenine-specific)